MNDPRTITPKIRSVLGSFGPAHSTVQREITKLAAYDIVASIISQYMVGIDIDVAYIRTLGQQEHHIRPNPRFAASLYLAAEQPADRAVLTTKWKAVLRGYNYTENQATLTMNAAIDALERGFVFPAQFGRLFARAATGVQSSRSSASSFERAVGGDYRVPDALRRIAEEADADPSSIKSRVQAELTKTPDSRAAHRQPATSSNATTITVAVTANLSDQAREMLELYVNQLMAKMLSSQEPGRASQIHLQTIVQVEPDQGYETEFVQTLTLHFTSDGVLSR